MKNSIEQLFFKVSNNPLSKLIGKLSLGPLTILMYHRISDAKDQDKNFSPCRDLLEVTSFNFESHIKYLSENYRCISLTQAIKELANNSLVNSSIVITFDDGYIDNYTIAAPILEKYQVPATFYICTDFPEKKAFLWWYEIEHIISSVEKIEISWREINYSLDCSDINKKSVVFKKMVDLFIGELPNDQKNILELLYKKTGTSPNDLKSLSMNWSHISSLAKNPLFEIGAHTTTHQILRLITQDEANHEMIRSREILEEKLGTPIKHFAYPFGYPRAASTREFELARKAGFESSVTTRFSHIWPGHQESLHALPRIAITNITTENFKIRIGGWEAFLRQNGKKIVTN